MTIFKSMDMRQWKMVSLRDKPYMTPAAHCLQSFQSAENDGL